CWCASLGGEPGLDFVARYRRHGPRAPRYFPRYSVNAPEEDLRAEAGWVDGVAVIAVFRPASSSHPAYFIRIDWRGDRIAHVRDFRYVPDLTAAATFQPSPGGSPSASPG